MKKFLIYTVLLASIAIIAPSKLDAVAFQIPQVKGRACIVFVEEYEIEVREHPVVSNTYDISLRNTNALDKSFVFITRAHDAVINSIAFSCNKEKFITAGADGYIRAWTTETGEFLEEIKCGAPCLYADFIKDDWGISFKTIDGAFEFNTITKDCNKISA